MQISDNIVDILYTCRKTYQVVTDADLFALRKR
jgi:hypothetical protein